jgi:hypothetical protein
MPSAQTPELSQIAAAANTPAGQDVAETIVNTSVSGADPNVKKPEAKTPQVTDKPAAETPTEPSAEETQAEEEAKAAKEAEDKKASKRKEIKELSKLIAERRRENDRIKAERSRLEQERRQFRDSEGKFQSTLQAAQKDPFSFLESHGIMPEDLAKKVVERGEKQSPEQLALAAANEAKELAQRLAKELEQTRAEAKEAERARTAQANNDKFLAKIMDESKYPSVSTLWDKSDIFDELSKMGREAVNAGLAKGYTRDQMVRELNSVSDDTTMELLEERAATKLEALQKKLGGKTKEEPAKETPKVAATSKVATTSTSKTLTAKSGSEKASGDIPLDRLPEAEQNKILAQRMKAMRSK